MTGNEKLAIAKAEAIRRLNFSEGDTNIEVTQGDKKLILAKAKTTIVEKPTVVKKETPKEATPKKAKAIVKKIIEKPSEKKNRIHEAITQKDCKTETALVSQINSFNDRLEIAERNATTHPLLQNRKTAQQEADYLRASLARKEEQLKKWRNSKK